MSKKARKIISLCAMVMMVVLALTGCSNSAPTHSAKVVVIAPRILEEYQTAFDSALREGLPELNTEESKLLIQCISAGDTSVDAMTAAAGASKVMMLFTANEIEIMICDADSAFRYGENGKAYLALDKIFTADEQQQMGIKPLTIALTDAEGNLTGAQSAACGIDLSENELIKNTFKMSNLGLYVVDDGANKNLANIKTVIGYIMAN